MSIDRRLGLAALILTLVGLAAPYLWPEKKSIGWLSFSGALILILVWASLELRAQPKLRLPILVCVATIAVCVSLIVISRAQPNKETVAATRKESLNNPATLSASEITDEVAKKLTQSPIPTRMGSSRKPDSGARTSVPTGPPIQTLKPGERGRTEIDRRMRLLDQLRSEYILSHDGISAALMAGTEQPPADWTNRRLGEMGEKWKISTTPPTETMSGQEAFAVAVETRIFAPPGGRYGTSFWAFSPAPGGCALKSVQAALFIRITNLQKERSLITAYTVEAMGVPLTRIKMNLYKPFVILGKGVMKPSNQPSARAVQIPVPQGGIGSLVMFKPEDAYPAEARPIVERFLDPQIEGYLEHKQMVRGWAFFEYPNLAIFPANLVLKISDETGRTFSYSISDTGSDQNADAMSRTLSFGPTVDLSTCSIDR